MLAGGHVAAARAEAPQLPPQAASCAVTGICASDRAFPRAGPLSEDWIRPGRGADHAPPLMVRADPDPAVVIAPVPPSSVLMLAGLAVLAFASLRRGRKS